MEAQAVGNGVEESDTRAKAEEGCGAKVCVVDLRPTKVAKVIESVLPGFALALREVLDAPPFDRLLVALMLDVPDTLESPAAPRSITPFTTCCVVKSKVVNGLLGSPSQTISIFVGSETCGSGQANTKPKLPVSLVSVRETST